MCIRTNKRIRDNRYACVCVCMYIYIYMPVCIHARMNACMCAYMSACMKVSPYILRLYIRIHCVPMKECFSQHVRMRVRYVCSKTRIYEWRTCTHVFNYVRMYTFKYVRINIITTYTLAHNDTSGREHAAAISIPTYDLFVGRQR